MAPHNGPYYTTSSQSIDDLESNAVHDGQGSLYPDLRHQATSDAQMYALADDALQAHQNNATSQFAGLIQAATAVAGQDERHTPDMTGPPRRSTRRSQRFGYDQRTLESEQDEPVQAHNTPLRQSNNGRKRKRAVRGLEKAGADEGSSLLDDTRLLDAPSTQLSQAASALFRRSSSTSKKSARPPKSKLFTSLELSPEGFLQLQSAAKHYMLNDTFPERKNTVGQRGRTDSDLVKLRLWNCAKDFLHSEGNGDRFFGPEVLADEGRVRTMFWPSDKNAIIAALTPLLRRMVTNERQRRYAVETRKPGCTGETRGEKMRKLNNGQPSVSQRDKDEQVHDIQHRDTEVGFPRLFKEINTMANLAEYDAWRRPEAEEILGQIQQEYFDIWLLPSEFYGLIATMDYHIRIDHGCDCDFACEAGLINHILAVGHLDNKDWADEVASRRGRFKEMLSKIFNMTRAAINKQVDADAALPRQDPKTAKYTAAPESAATEATVTTAHLDDLDDDTSAQPITLHLNVLKEGKRFVPLEKVAADQYNDWETAREKIGLLCGDDGMASAKIMVLLPNGLVEIKDDTEWKGALSNVQSLEWMDAELKIIVEL